MLKRCYQLNAGLVPASEVCSLQSSRRWPLGLQQQAESSTRPGPPAQQGEKVVGGSSNFPEVVLRAVLRAAHQ